MRRLVRRHAAIIAGALTLVAALCLALLPRLGLAAEPDAGQRPAPVALGPGGAGPAERVSAASRDTARVAPLPATVGRYEGRIAAQTRQLLVVRAESRRTTHAQVLRYVRGAKGWTHRNTWAARIGYGGLVRGAARVQGTGTTPTGAYAITESFGRSPDPGAALPYRHLTKDDWWVQDRRSPYYNQRRLGSQGGFARTTSGRNGSEHLRAMGRQYDYVAVIDFNRPEPVVGRGSGIFLHVRNGRPTAGCVSIGRAHMRTVLRWLEPRKAPVVVIGTRAGLRS